MPQGVGVGSTREASPRPGATTGLIARGVSKAFGETRALKNVTASFPRGAITALLGQNGSGKSTLIKILAGFYDADGDPEITVGGVRLDTPVNPKLAHASGLRFLHQDLGLVDTASIADNFAFADRFDARLLGPIRQGRENARVSAMLARFGIDREPGTPVGGLTPTERTMVAIARAFADADEDEKNRVLIMDEPTASLPASEVDRVFRALTHVRDAGGTVIFISHRIDEVMRIADRVVVLRDGELQADREMTGLNAEDIVTLIVGHNVEGQPRGSTEHAGEVVLQATRLSGRRLSEVDLVLHAGEVVGVTGLLGCGRSELARVVSGAQQPTSGALSVDGRSVALGNPRAAITAGIGFVPQERRTQGCIPTMTVRENLTLTGLKDFWRGWRLSHGEERKAAWSSVEKFDIRPASTEISVSKLSGGNQQKVVVAKWTRQKPRVLVLDEPTQGIDIGAKREIATIVRDLADDGVAVLVGSSDIDELVDMCDRVIVLNRGQIIAEVEGEEVTEERLTFLAATGEEMAA